MSTEPTNDELAQGYAKQIEQAQQRREAKDLERLERHGQAAAQQSQAIEAEQKQGQQGQGFELDAGQKVELNEINGQQAKTLAKELNRDNENGDQVKQARAREIAETHAGGRLIAFLEGGYDPPALARSVAATLAVLDNADTAIESPTHGADAPHSQGDARE